MFVHFDLGNSLTDFNKDNIEKSLPGQLVVFYKTVGFVKVLT